MKYNLGYDIGTNSVGAVLTDENNEIITTIVSAIDNDLTGYNNKNFKSPNAVRREQRGIRVSKKHKKRKLNDIKLFLSNVLNINIEIINDIIYNKVFDVTPLKVKGLSSQLSIEELIRVLYNYTLYNGYNELDDEIDDSKSEYKQKMNIISNYCKEKNFTISQFIKFNIKNKNNSEYIEELEKKQIPLVTSAHQDKIVFNTEQHREELKRILKTQSKFYKNITHSVIDTLFAKIYYRVPLKSQKHLRANCELEPMKKCVSKSNPYFGLLNTWTYLNNMKIKNNGNEIMLPYDLKLYLFEHINKTLETSDKGIIRLIKKYLTKELYLDSSGEIYYNGIFIGDFTEFFKKDIDKYLNENKHTDKAIDKLIKASEITINYKSVKGNKTYIEITKILNEFNVSTQSLKNSAIEKYNIDDEYALIKLLWSIIKKERKQSDRHNELSIFFNKNFIDFDKDIIEKLSSLSYNGSDISGYSEKAIRRLIPNMNGEEDCLNIYDAIDVTYGHDNFTINTDATKLELLEKSALRNPIVEKVMNNIIGITNELIDKYSIKKEELTICVEMTRDINNSKKVRGRIEASNKKNKKINDECKKLIEENGFRSNPKKIKKVKLWLEQGGKYDSKTYKETKSAIGVYSGRKITLNILLGTEQIDVEHTVPKSLYMSNAMSNLTVEYHSVNGDKDNMTGQEFIDTYSITEQNQILSRIEEFYGDNPYKKKFFTYTKENMPPKLPGNQLVQTAYINKKITKLFKEFGVANVYMPQSELVSYIKQELGVSDYFNKSAVNNTLESVDVDIDKLIEDGGMSKRYDLRNHAVDAYVTSLCTQKEINIINSFDKNNGRIIKLVEEKLPRDINDIVDTIVDNTLVIYKTKNNRGQLHKDSYYSLDEDSGRFVTKVGLYSVKDKDNILSLDILNILEEEKNSGVQFFIDIDIKNRLENLLNNNGLTANDFIMKKQKDVKSDVLINKFKTLIDSSNDPLLQRTKKVKVYKSKNATKSILKIEKPNKAFHTYVQPCNNYITASVNNGEEIKSITLTLMEYNRNLNDFMKSNDVLFYVKPNEYLVYGYDKDTLTKMIENGDNSFYNNLVYVRKMNDGKVSTIPHYISAHKHKKLKNNYDTLIGVYYGMGNYANTLDKLRKLNNVITKVKINKIGEITPICEY